MNTNCKCSILIGNRDIQIDLNVIKEKKTEIKCSQTKLLSKYNFQCDSLDCAWIEMRYIVIYHA